MIKRLGWDMTPRMLVTTALLASAAGCGLDDNDDAAGTAPVGTTADSPALVASLTLDNGNQLEFYGFERGALLSETGLAGTTSPRFNPQGQPSADQLTTIWRTLAPGRSVPASLTRLQERLTN